MFRVCLCITLVVIVKKFVNNLFLALNKVRQKIRHLSVNFQISNILWKIIPQRWIIFLNIVAFLCVKSSSNSRHCLKLQRRRKVFSHSHTHTRNWKSTKNILIPVSFTYEWNEEAGKAFAGSVRWTSPPPRLFVLPLLLPPESQQHQSHNTITIANTSMNKENNFACVFFTT